MTNLLIAIRNNEAELLEQRLGLAKKDIEISDLKDSKSIRVGYYVLHPHRLLIDGPGIFIAAGKSVARKLRQWKSGLDAERAYSRAKLTPIKKADTAVVVHLYYTDAWSQIAQRLKQLDQIKFDLYVTLSARNKSFASTVRQDFDGAIAIIVPNRGRDVLPFMYVAERLKLAGYSYVLKLHSKKSPHMESGFDWFTSMINSLVPSNPTLQQELKATLVKPQAGLVGPQGQYVSLPVNYAANRKHLRTIVADLAGQDEFHKLDSAFSSFGFFAGTMFWARIDALSSILDKRYTPKQFEVERGQIDATFAHALERAFCIIPELNNKDIFEVGKAGVRKLDYQTRNIPSWSELNDPIE